MADAQGILLEAGTNEMELLVFTLKSTSFGINVAKVREIIQRSKTISIPYSPAAVEGSFKVREQIMTLVNLGKHFAMEGEQIQNGEGMTIIVEFNKIRCGILVDSVERIYRLSWDDIQSPSQYLQDLSVPVTGVVKVDKKVILVVDFETIISNILGVDSVSDVDIDSSSDDLASAKNAEILLVDDSHVVRQSLVANLNNNGYENLTVCTDGQHAWNTIQARRDEGNGTFDLMLCDIEMPQMDGLHLTSKIKDDPELKVMPVVLFSSLITQDNLNKGKAVGADAQVAKPDSEGMMKAIQTFLAKNQATVTV